MHISSDSSSVQCPSAADRGKASSRGRRRIAAAEARRYECARTYDSVECPESNLSDLSLCASAPAEPFQPLRSTPGARQAACARDYLQGGFACWVRGADRLRMLWVAGSLAVTRKHAMPGKLLRVCGRCVHLGVQNGNVTCASGAHARAPSAVLV